MEEKEIFSWKDNLVNLIVILVLNIILMFYQPIIGFIAFLVLGYLVYRHFVNIVKLKRDLLRYVENLSDDFDSATKHAVFNMPFPLALLDINGKIKWYNTRFIDMFDYKDILHKNIEEIIPSLKVDAILNNKKNYIDTIFMEKNILFYHNIVETKTSSGGEESIIILYGIDNTEDYLIKKSYEDENLVVCLAYIDNFDDVKNNTLDIVRPIVFAEIDRTLNEYVNNHNGILRKYENDKYFIVLEQRDLDEIKRKKFDILDEIRQINKGNNIPITLSLGIGAQGDHPFHAFQQAQASIDIALGRGGDQAVVKEGPNLSFFGGETKAMEKSNKVRSRVISHALRQIIDQSSNVFVMGHKNTDMDSFGASIGILRAAKMRKKKGYFVLQTSNPSIKNILDRVKREAPNIFEQIIKPGEAEKLIDKESVLVVVDNHRASYTEAPELLELTDKIVLIDHHRRGVEFIKEPILTYLEPYASSASELVTEILFYMSDRLEITKIEAEALLAGITVDTKNFSFQTGVRTFEAASVLKRAGADTAIVKEFFNDDYHTFLYKAEVIKNSKILFDRIAIGRLERDMEDSILIAAQSANELLNINGVIASFVLTLAQGKVHISGRSSGQVSVQLILEKLGGGGHLTSAGAQLEGVTIDEAEEKLIKIIGIYKEEGEKK